jgi:AraC-like DNA-binding protein
LLRASPRRRPRAWTGALALAPGHALFVGEPGDNIEHAHQAIQLCVALEGELSIRLAGGRRLRAAGVAIAANVRHRIGEGAGVAAFLYVDPRSALGSAVARRLGDAEWSRVADAALGAVRSPAMRGVAAGALFEPILRAFGVTAPVAAPLDARVAAAIAWIEAQLGAGRVSAAAVARAAGVSESRLAALFRRDTGVALRAFVLWTRLRVAIAAIARGRPATEAALAAGFADAAHLSRTFRRMFGTTLGASVARFSRGA